MDADTIKKVDEEKLNRIRANLDYQPAPWGHVITLSVAPPILIILLLCYMGVGFWLSFGITINVWAIIYWKYVCEHLWVSSDPDKALLLQDILKKGKRIRSETDLTDPLSLSPDIRAVGGSRINPKKITEKPLGNLIDLTVAEIAGSTFTAQDKNKTFWNITWGAPVTFLAGRYAARTPFVDPKLAMEFATARFVSTIREGLMKEDGNEVTKNKKAFIEKYLEPSFGGDRKISVEEIQYARSFGTPFITNMEQEGETKKATELDNTSRAIAGAIENIAGKDKKLSPDQAGILLALAMNPEAGILNIAGISAFGGGKSNKKKKK